MHMTVASSDFKLVVVRNSFLFPQTTFWYIDRNFSFWVPTVTLQHLRNVNMTMNSVR